MVCDKQITKIRFVTTSTCITGRPTLEVGKSTGTVQRPHWGDSSESLNLDGAHRGYYSSTMPKTTVSLWLGRFVDFPLWGIFGISGKAVTFLSFVLKVRRKYVLPEPL